MPLVYRLAEKWREIREERLRGEESRRRVFESLSSEDKDKACREIAAWLKEADSSSNQDDDYYYSRAQRRIAGFRWQLYRLNRPFIWLEKQVIEPLNFWSDRADVFQFFSKVSPVIEAIGVLAIPIVIFSFESRREEKLIEFEKQRDERQDRLEKAIISNQADVRKQQAVREYLSQITDIYLEVKNPDDIRANENLNDLLEATTLSILEELSISEDSQIGLGKEDESDLYEGDRRREVIKFLYKLGWIQGYEPLISLSTANLEGAYLFAVNLGGANLEGAYLKGADLTGADLEGANLKEADLERVYLMEANLEGVDLVRANLWGANLAAADLEGASLWGADLGGAYLEGAYLEGAYLPAADLGGANLEGANLFRANLENANLEGVYLEGPKFCNTKMPDEVINNRDCKYGWFADFCHEWGIN